MSDQPPPTTAGPSPDGFQPRIEALEGYHALAEIPPPVNPLQAQTAFEKRARMEDNVGHVIAIIQTSGFFLLAFAALLGFVNISNAATATFLGTVMGYAVGKVDPILTRYFSARIRLVKPQNGVASNGATPTTAPQTGQASTPTP
jgi:hypothetical protein